MKNSVQFNRDLKYLYTLIQIGNMKKINELLKPFQEIYKERLINGLSPDRKGQLEMMEYGIYIVKTQS
jgi:hypothetical protein